MFRAVSRTNTLITPYNAKNVQMEIIQMERKNAIKILAIYIAKLYLSIMILNLLSVINVIKDIIEITNISADKILMNQKDAQTFGIYLVIKLCVMVVKKVMFQVIYYYYIFK